MEQEFTGKVALITGAGSGIGKEVAKALAEKGTDIAVADIDFDLAYKTAEEIKALGQKAIAVKVDVSSYDEVRHMVEIVLREFGKIDILVNAAGVSEVLPAEEITSDQWNKIIGVNLNGTFFCCQAVGKVMIEHGGGKIINISSTLGFVASPKMVHYVASKFGVIGVTKALAVEWAKYNILVNAVAPGIVDTPFIRKSGLPSEMFQARVKRIPLKQIAKPRDVANAIVFLASSYSDYITGEVLLVDGGQVALSSGFSEAI